MSAKPRALIVEDEIVVALFLEDFWTNSAIGWGRGHQLDEATAREPDYDIAVLDVHINCRNVFDFADLLAGRDPPSSLPPAMANGASRATSRRPALQKPFQPETSGASLPPTSPPSLARAARQSAPPKIDPGTRPARP